MYPNLMGQKAYHKLTSAQMGEIIGLSRQSYESKMANLPLLSVSATVYSGKSFDFLFATEEEVRLGNG